MERVIPIVLNGEPRLICEADLRNICALENIPYDSPPSTPVNRQITENQPPPAPSQGVQTESVETPDPKPVLETVPASFVQTAPLKLLESGNLIAIPITAENLSAGGETFLVNTGPDTYQVVTTQPTELVISPEEQNSDPEFQLSDMLKFVQRPGTRPEPVSVKSPSIERHKEMVPQLHFNTQEGHFEYSGSEPVKSVLKPESPREEHTEILLQIAGVGYRTILFPAPPERVDYNVIAKLAQQLLPTQTNFVATQKFTSAFVPEKSLLAAEVKDEMPVSAVEPMEVDPPVDSTKTTPQPVPPVSPAQALLIRSANTGMRAGQTLVVSQTQPIILANQFVTVTQPVVTSSLGSIVLPVQAPAQGISKVVSTAETNEVVSNGVKDGGGKQEDSNELLGNLCKHCNCNSRDLKICQNCKRPLHTKKKINSQGLSAQSQELPPKQPSTEHFRCFIQVRCDSCGKNSTSTDICTHCKKLLPGNAPKMLYKVKASNQDYKDSKRKCQRKKKVEEPVTLSLLSSDEEEGSHSENKPSPPPTRVISKEPIITEETESPFHNERIEGGGLDMEGALSQPGVERALMCCRSVRIGSYKTVPDGKVAFTEWGFFLSIPALGTRDLVTIKVMKNEIIKVLANFGRECPVLFYYTTARAADRLRRELQMRDSQRGPWYDPTSGEEMFRRITILPDKVPEETRLFLRTTYDNQCLLETLNNNEVDAILVQASPSEAQLSKSAALQSSHAPSSQPAAPAQMTRGRDSFMQPPGTPMSGNTASGTPVAPHLVQRIMVYPPPPAKGGISINTEDYGCLGEENFLNDVIIDFYLKYFVQTQLSPEDQKRTHVFSSFFYKRLTTKDPPMPGDKRTAAERRHHRVRGWTKQVDLFSKDFIIIPINENSHWFLGVICFPGLTHAVRLSDGKAVPNPSKRKGHIPHVIGGTTITRVNQEPMTITLEPDEEDRDEADADDDDLEPNTSDEEPVEETEDGSDLLDDATHPPPKAKPKKEPQEPIKQPCILIFDSLAGASRSKVCATLREYLQIEYNVRHRDTKGKRDINKNTMKASVIKVPQQNNYTDCGLYVLQYTEAFFQNPILDYRMPIRQLVDWFDTSIVSKKRYQIQQLLHALMDELNVDTSRLNLPVLNLHPDGTGKPYHDDDEEGMEEMDMEDFEEMGEEEEEMMGEEEEEEMREFARAVSRGGSSIPSLPTVVQQVPTAGQQGQTSVQQPSPSQMTAPSSDDRGRKGRKEITISSSVAPSISSAISITTTPVAAPSPVKPASTTTTPTLPQSISLTRKFITTPDSTSKSHSTHGHKLEGISITPTGSNSVKRKVTVKEISSLKDVRNPRVPSQTPPTPSRSIEIKKVRPE